MARAIWKGAISFGLVTIPIRLHTAVEEKSFKFNQLHSKDQGRMAVAKIAFRDKEHLATLRVRDGVFVLETMYWPDEIRQADFEELDAEVKIAPQELQMAKSLIDNMTGEFDPEEFKDEYREKLENIVEQKIEGKEIAVVEEAGTAKVLDLIEALKASVDATSKEAPAKKPAKKKKTAASA